MFSGKIASTAETIENVEYKNKLIEISGLIFLKFH